MTNKFTRRSLLVGGVSLPVALASRGAVGAAQSDVDLYVIVGRIKWFDAQKGYGFIVPENGLPDVLLTRGCLLKSGRQGAHEGTRVCVEAWQHRKGLVAWNVVAIGPEAYGPAKPREHTIQQSPAEPV